MCVSLLFCWAISKEILVFSPTRASFNKLSSAIKALDIEKAVLALYDVPRSVPKEKP